MKTNTVYLLVDPNTEEVYVNALSYDKKSLYKSKGQAERAAKALGAKLIEITGKDLLRFSIN